MEHTLYPLVKILILGRYDMKELSQLPERLIRMSKWFESGSEDGNQAIWTDWKN